MNAFSNMFQSLGSKEEKIKSLLEQKLVLASSTYPDYRKNKWKIPIPFHCVLPVIGNQQIIV
jgi:hypothetical protein